MTRVLVTGATGLIGRGTLAPLIAAGAEVHAVSSRPGPPERDGVCWHRANLLDEGAVERLIGGVRPAQLLHLAWYAEPGRFWSSPENLRWVRGSLALVEAFAEAGGERVVLAGSCSEYAWEERTVCSERFTPCRPATLYGVAKHGLRTIVERYAAEVGMSAAWGRVFFVFGPGEDPRRLGGSVARALTRGEVARCSHGRQLRDFMYSEDLAAAFVALLLSEVEGSVNLASGQATSVAQLVGELARAAGQPELVELGAIPAPAGEPAELLADVTRLREEVGFVPSRTLTERAADTIAWWRAEAARDARD